MSSNSVVSDLGEAVVSITTHGHRLNTVALAIESIGVGTKRPRSMILWLEEPEFASRWPANLRRLVRRGLEVRISDALGPHSKYYSYAIECSDASLPLVLADDDRLYPRSWLAGLLGSYAEHPDCISCYRARVVTMTRDDDGWRMSPYDSWPYCRACEPSLLTFATATGGVIYPPAMLDHVRGVGDRFLLCAPHSNDIWLHHLALRAGIPTRQIQPDPVSAPTIPNTQDIALYLTVNAVYKDQQIRDTYDDDDVASLAGELASSKAALGSGDTSTGPR